MAVALTAVALFTTVAFTTVVFTTVALGAPSAGADPVDGSEPTFASPRFVPDGDREPTAMTGGPDHPDPTAGSLILALVVADVVMIAGGTVLLWRRCTVVGASPPG